MEYRTQELEGPGLATDTEARLRAEIEELKRKVDEQERLLRHSTGHESLAPPAPSRRFLWLLALLLVILIVAAFFKGYLPRRQNEATLAAEAATTAKEAPTVTVVGVERSASSGTLVLPGNIEAVTEAPVLARASGYILKRYADIGDRVKSGQLLAEIDAPELDQQVHQAQASLEQAGAALEQANANLQQGKATEQLAKVTADRWTKLVSKGVVSRQDNDTYQSQYAAAQANVQALEKAINAARSNQAAVQANLSRLTDLQNFKSVRAPFAGVITQRNVDVGALVSEASTLLFRIAQADRLRTYVNVPQTDAANIRTGQVARLSFSELPGQQFTGTVTRTANSLDPASRTLLTEVQVPNPSGKLLPGMYTQVDLTTPRTNPPLIIPGDTLVMRSDGAHVALLGASNTVHFQLVQLGRDYGEKIEVLSGLQTGQQIIVNPGDSIHEGVKVNPVPLREKKHSA